MTLSDLAKYSMTR